MNLRQRTKHTSDELKIRAKLALAEVDLIEIVEANEKPSGAQKTALLCGFSESSYSVWALAALKRDYPNIYNNIQEVKNFRSNK